MGASVSSEFKSLVKTSHRIVTKVEILKNGAVQSMPVNFNLISGSVTEDKTASVRRQASFQLVDPTGTLIPSDLTGLIAPNTNEIKPYRGVMTSTGPEYVALGVFGFRDVVMDDDGSNLTISIQGFDRSEKISRESFLAAYAIAAGTAIETAIQNIISSRITGLTYVFPSTGFTTPSITYDRGTDPWKACTDLAESAGFELFFDNTGQLILQQEPNPIINPVSWTFTDGADAVISRTQRKLSSPTYNHVIEIAEGSNIPVPFSAEAQDNNSGSPTWVGYGDFPLFEVSSLFTNASQCQAAADARLRKILGATENVNFDCVPNPALFASDIIQVTQSRVKISSTTYVVDKVTTPMNADSGQSCTVRERVASS